MEPPTTFYTREISQLIEMPLSYHSFLTREIFLSNFGKASLYNAFCHLFVAVIKLKACYSSYSTKLLI